MCEQMMLHCARRWKHLDCMACRDWVRWSERVVDVVHASASEPLCSREQETDACVHARACVCMCVQRNEPCHGRCQCWECSAFARIKRVPGVGA